MNIFGKYVMLSFCLHLALFTIPMLFGAESQRGFMGLSLTPSYDLGGPTAPEPFIEIDTSRIIDKIPASMTEGVGEEKDCEDWFGGVGITHSFREIIKVNKGYPAEKAGVKVGDIILNEEELRGEVGTEVTMLIIRDGDPLEFTFERGKICTEDT